MTERERDRWICEACWTIVAPLTAPDPWGWESTIYACPSCRAVERIVAACGVAGCGSGASVHGPAPGGAWYLSRCAKHSGDVA